MVFPTTDVYASPIALRKKAINLFHVWVKFPLDCLGGESNALMENFMEKGEKVDLSK